MSAPARNAAYDRGQRIFQIRMLGRKNAARRAGVVLDAGDVEGLREATMRSSGGCSGLSGENRLVVVKKQNVANSVRMTSAARKKRFHENST